MIRNKVFLIVLCFICISTSIFSQSIEKATLLQRSGLREEAKKELIEVIFAKTNDMIKASAYYSLGNILFEENKIASALDTWRDLIAKYSSSNEAKLVKDKIQELAQIIGATSKETVTNAIAQSYLRSADFWSKGKDEIFNIDSSWIPRVEAAIKWYDKVINDFPKTNASRLAYQEKLRTLIGWSEPGTYGSKYGIDESFTKYMPLLLETFSSFENDHPDDTSLQAFRYQIAQVYWNNKDWDKTREWLNIIISKSGKSDAFYKDLATRRLLKVEY